MEGFLSGLRGAVSGGDGLREGAGEQRIRYLLVKL